MNTQKSAPVKAVFTDEIKQSVKKVFNYGNQVINSQTDLSGATAKANMFFNFGYISNENPQYSNIQIPEGIDNKNQVKMILELTGGCDLIDREILDIGCGRGGNAHIIDQFFSVKKIVGIDICSEAIAFCQKFIQTDRLSFMEGDAENLPFAKDSFDIVVNVESSNCYPNILKFFTEVQRVLKTGGYFLYTDIMTKELADSSISFLEKIGFSLDLERDITSNVFLSIDDLTQGNNASLSCFDGLVEGNARVLEPGSDHYNYMKDNYLYKMYRFQKKANNLVEIQDHEQMINRYCLTYSPVASKIDELASD